LLVACGTGGSTSSGGAGEGSSASGSASTSASTSSSASGSASTNSSGAAESSASGGASGSAGTSSGATGEKPTVKIGSKGFTEQLILSEMMAALLEDAGYTVERNLNLNNTAIAHQALLSGEIDTYPEYTGTSLTSVLNLPVQSDAQQVYNTVKQEYADQFQLAVLDSIGFNSTYAMVMSQARAQELGITKLSDLQGKAEELVLGTGAEFLDRPDGLPGLEAKYNINFKEDRTMDLGIMYDAVAQGDVDIVAGISTDGRIPALDLVVIEDDQGFFPPYIAVPVVRQALLDQAPEVGDILNKLAGKIDETTMAQLNGQVDQEGQEPAEVARTFLTEQGLLQ
jgi:glycine betaine/choline ABC-type transport system substrate-binding protein